MDIGDAISTLVELLVYLFQVLLEAIALPIRFVASREYRLRKYKQWEASGWRRALDAFTVLGATAAIAIAAFWVWGVLRPADEIESIAHPAGSGSAFEVVTDSSNGQRQVTLRLDGSDVQRVVTSKVARAAFSNFVRWVKTKGDDEGEPGEVKE